MFLAVAVIEDAEDAILEARAARLIADDGTSADDDCAVSNDVL